MDNSISWVATGLTILAALMTASNLGARITGIGFAVFAVGSVAWLATGIMTAQPALAWTNAVLLLLNLFGVWRWLGRQARIEEGGSAAQERSEALASETLFPASLLAKAPVVGRDGAQLGTSVDAMLGCRSGRPAYLVVAEGGVAGVGETLRRLDWSEATVDGDRVVIALDHADFCELEALSRDRWPGR